MGHNKTSSLTLLLSWLRRPRHLFVFFAAETSRRVRHLHVELTSALDDGRAVAGRDVVRNLSAVLAVVHEKEVEILDVVDNELQKTVRQQVSRLLRRTVTDVGHRRQALELAALARVNTLRASP